MKKERPQINATSGFKDRDAIREQRTVDSPVNGRKSPWDFTCPQYDQRSSNFLNAGTHFGVGRTQPIGTHKQSGKYALPLGRHHTMRDDEVG